MNNGWIKIHRKILQWEWYTDANTFRLFVHCLLKANHEPKKWRGHPVDKGEFITSLSTLSKELGMNIQQIRTSLNKLSLTHQLTHQTNTKFSLIKVKNYDFYQDTNTPTNTRVTHKSTHQLTHKSTHQLTHQNSQNKQSTQPKNTKKEETTNTPTNTPPNTQINTQPNNKQEYKNIRNNIYTSNSSKESFKSSKMTVSNFEDFWKEYPRKIAKATVRSKYLKLPSELQETILESVRRYKQTKQWQENNGQYIPHPTTWVNQRRWEDELNACQFKSPEEETLDELIARLNSQ